MKNPVIWLGENLNKIYGKSDERTEQEKETHPLDADFKKRERTPRYLALGLYVILLPTTGVLLGSTLAAIFFDDLTFIGSVFGFALAILTVVASVERLFIIRNKTTGMFVTQDALRSLLGLEGVNVSYGPGVHVAFPWERRLPENNISLEEAAQNFEFTVQCKDGVLTCKGSYRLRPDHSRGVTFLTGVASVASEISDLIIADAVSLLSKKPILEAMNQLAELNTFLMEEFSNDEKHTKMETRFGITVTDVTVKELLPSADVQKTISAIAEASAIATATAKLFGLTPAGLRKKVTSGEVSQQAYDKARDRIMAASGNMEGMELRRFEVDVSGEAFDPETMNALGEVLKSKGGKAALAALVGTTSKEKAGGSKKGKSKKSK